MTFRDTIWFALGLLVSLVLIAATGYELTERQPRHAPAPRCHDDRANPFCDRIPDGDR